MKRLRIVAVACLSLFLLVFCAGCGESTTSEVEENITSSDSTETTVWEEPAYTFPSGPEVAHGTIALSHWYQSMSELYNDTKYVVIGRVFLQEFPSTLQSKASYVQVWIDEVLSGDMQINQMITVSEIGFHFANEDEASVNAVPLLRPGERVLLFLNGPWEFVAPWETGYSLAGDYQGKFFYNQEENAWYPAGILGNQGALVFSDAAEPLSDKEFRMKLQDIIENK